ncbi:hypothetical protein QJS66_21415 [Kocuria rhizophila]|nr:hypothetical protein QJS66_21415 [Kocuria rhizophila]
MPLHTPSTAPSRPPRRPRPPREWLQDAPGTRPSSRPAARAPPPGRGRRSQHGIQVPVTDTPPAGRPGRHTQPPAAGVRHDGPGQRPARGWSLAAPDRGADDTEVYEARGLKLEDDGRSAVRRGVPSQQWREEAGAPAGPAGRVRDPDACAPRRDPEMRFGAAGSSATWNWCARRWPPGGGDPAEREPPGSRADGHRAGSSW